MYQVKFLDDEEFDRLPASDIHSKVGVAYPEIGEAYVRKTGVNVIDVFTAMHELEHLQGEDLNEHYDAENKCYYKGFGQVLQTVLPVAASFLLPGIGSALAPALGGIGSALSGAGSSIAGALGSVPGIGGALGGAAQSVGGALGSIGNAAGSALGAAGGKSSSAAAGPEGVLRQSLEGSSGLRNAPLPFQSASGAANPISGGVGGGVGSALSSGFGSSLADKLTGGQSGAGQSIVSQAAQGIFDPFTSSYPTGDGVMEMFGSGSEVPGSTNYPNVIPGASGYGSDGGAGGAPGGLGGSPLKKIKQQQLGGQ